MLHTLFPSIGDVIAAGFWLALGSVTAIVWREHRHDLRYHHPRRDYHETYSSDPPPGFRILPRPFDAERDL